MGEWMWASVVMAIGIIIAGGITWWLARGCARTITGAVGAILGGLAALACLVVLIDPEAALRVSPMLTVVSAIWLLGWALAGGVRGMQLAREDAAARPATDVDALATVEPHSLSRR